MKHRFEGSWRGQVVTVKNAGIYEHRNGNLMCFVPWGELERLDLRSVRGVTGATIFLGLSAKSRKEFLHAASIEWRQRYPDRCLRNQERILGDGDRVVFLWFPLGTLGPCLALQLLLRVLWRAEPLHEDMRKIDGITLLAVASVAGVLGWYAIKGRKAIAAPDMTTAIEGRG